MAIDKSSKCSRCGKSISDLEYIRYGGLCQNCWHFTNNCKCKICRKRMTPRDYKTYGGICPMCLSMVNKH